MCFYHHHRRENPTWFFMKSGKCSENTAIKNKTGFHWLLFQLDDSCMDACSCLDVCLERICHLKTSYLSQH